MCVEEPQADGAAAHGPLDGPQPEGALHVTSQGPAPANTTPRQVGRTSTQPSTKDKLRYYQVARVRLGDCGVVGSSPLCLVLDDADADQGRAMAHQLDLLTPHTPPETLKPTTDRVMTWIMLDETGGGCLPTYLPAGGRCWGPMPAR